jgi:hypothetical protein
MLLDFDLCARATVHAPGLEQPEDVLLLCRGDSAEFTAVVLLLPLLCS